MGKRKKRAGCDTCVYRGYAAGQVICEYILCTGKSGHARWGRSARNTRKKEKSRGGGRGTWIRIMYGVMKR